MLLLGAHPSAQGQVPVVVSCAARLLRRAVPRKRPHVDRARGAGTAQILAQDLQSEGGKNKKVNG